MMWRPAVRAIPVVRHPSLGQEEQPVAPVETPPVEEPRSWLTEVLIGTAGGALVGAFTGALEGKPINKVGPEIAAGGSAGFVVVNLLRLI